MKIRTDFVTNSSSSSYCVSLGVVTAKGKKLWLRVDPHKMDSSGADSNIYLYEDKHEAITKAKDIEGLCELMLATVDMRSEIEDEDTLFRECEYYGMDDELESYFEKVIKAETTVEKLKVYAKIKEDYYDREIKEIEASNKTPKEKETKIKEIQEKRNEDPGRGFGALLTDIENFRNKIKDKAPSIEQIQKIILSEEHYAWGEFVPESFWRMVKGILDDNTSCEGITFALSKKLAKNKQIIGFIEEHAGAISLRMNKNVNYLIADEDDETDSKIAKAKETSIPIITISELHKKFDLKLEPSDDRVIARLKEKFAEGSDFAGIIKALGSDGPNMISDSIDICIDMKTGNIEKSHFFVSCS